MTTTPTPETHEPIAPRWDAPAIAHLTVEEWERVEHLLPAVDALLGRMAVDGVADPVTVLRAAVDAGRDAAEAPILALARQVDPQAIRWAPEIEYLRVVNDLTDGVRLRTVIHACLDRIARVGVGVTRHPVAFPGGMPRHLDGVPVDNVRSALGMSSRLGEPSI